jgi:hypothetical protein
MEKLWRTDATSDSSKKASRARGPRRAYRHTYSSRIGSSWSCKSDRLFFAIRHAVPLSYPLPCSYKSSYADDLRKASTASIASAVARPIEGIQWE